MNPIIACIPLNDLDHHVINYNKYKIEYAVFEHMFFFLCCALQGPPSSRMNQKVTAESQSTASVSEHLSHREPSHLLLEGKFEQEFIVSFHLVCMLFFHQNMPRSSSYYITRLLFITLFFLHLFVSLYTDLLT